MFFILTIYFSKYSKNINANTLQTTPIYKSSTEKINETTTQRTLIFGLNVLEKTQCGKTCAIDMRVLLLRRFLNTTRVPNPAHPGENKPNRSTSIRRQIFWRIQQLDEQTPQVTASSPVLCSDGYSQLCIGTVSPPLGVASPS